METSFTEILRSNNSRSEKARLIADKIRLSGGYPWAGVYDVKENGLNGRAVMQGKTVIVNDIDKDEDYLLTFTNTKSEIVVPVFDKTGKQIVGTIDVEGEKTNAFGDEDVKFLEECARDISELWNNE